MRMIQIPWTKFSTPYVDPWTRTMEIKDWCKEQGLREDVDFDCFYVSGNQTHHVRFYLNGENYASLFALKFL